MNGFTTAVVFHLGEVVHRKVRPEFAGMVTGILFRPHGVAYYVTWESGEEEACWEIELATGLGFKPPA